MSTRRKVIGVLREAKSKWERRAPLTPDAVRQLVARDIQVLVQPSTRRVFSNREYEQAGATITEDLSAANCIFSVKEFPKITDRDRGRAFMLFSHVIKAQRQNMPFLDDAVRHGVRLFDYEAIRATKANGGQRLVAFGHFAGLAGMIDGFRCVGERLLSLGYSSPFMGVSSSFMYPSVEAAKRAVDAMGKDIKRVGIHDNLLPMVFTFTGQGNVSTGAREVFDLLPHQYVAAEDLPRLPKDPHTVFATVATAKHMVQKRADVQANAAAGTGAGTGAGGQAVSPASDGTGAWDTADYYSNPQNYEPVFHERIAPYTSVLVNGMYWDPRFPRLITIEQMKELQRRNRNKLLAVADISCDIDGSVEFLKKSTTIDNPFFLYDPFTDQITSSLEGDGVVMMGVDNLPTEFPREASAHFSEKLLPFVESLSLPPPADTPFTQQKQYPPELYHSCIVADNALTPDFQYIAALRARQERASRAAAAAAPAAATTPAAPAAGAGASAEGAGVGTPSNAGKYPVTQSVLLEGHLFDSGFINQALDLIEAHAADFEVLHWAISPNRAERANNVSRAVISVSTHTQAQLQTVIDHVTALTLKMPIARASLKVLPYAPTAASSAAHLKHTASASGGTQAPAAGGAARYVAGKPEKSVLVLGSGFVAGPLVEYLARRNSVTVASALLDEALSIAAGHPNVRAVTLDANDSNAMREAVRRADLVVSFLPAPFHPAVAKHCIAERKHLVTASYVSAALKELDSAARAAGITVMNEVGLDPGIDHMSALKTIHEVQAHGGVIESFESVCGGLPAPECADNPLGYKFSWNPRGVLTATQNAARYLRDGKVVEVTGANLLKAARPLELNPAFNLEVLPNRDSLSYAEDYGLQSAKTLYRGTLRYHGFCSIVDRLRAAGLLSADKLVDIKQHRSWAGLLSSLLDNATPATVEAALRSRLQAVEGSGSGMGESKAAIERTVNAARWLGVLSGSEEVSVSRVAPQSANGRVSILDVFCHLLEKKLAYVGEERDAVLLHHTFGVRWAGNKTETRTSTLISYGGEGGKLGRTGAGGGGGWSAMARTVGFPAAITAQIILDGGYTARGVLRPFKPELYNPVLDLLKREGIAFVEKTIPN